MRSGQTLKPGARLGPYEIVALAGAGGMGEVYRAQDTRLNRTVAIKVLPPEVSGLRERKERFEREARAVAALNHPHICTLHDIGHSEGIDYLVLEYLEGQSLASRLAHGPLSIEQGLQYAIEIADALAKAHEKGVVHRDLKPGNIMVGKFGSKLLDFGLARQDERFPGQDSSEQHTRDSELTVEGTLLGTLQYMAPEQLEGRLVDARSDIFSFGVVVYEMLTGRKAFEGQSQASVIASILKSDPPPMSTLLPLAPPALDNVVRGCLSKDPADRWQTMHDVAKQLRWISTSPGSETLQKTASTVSSRRRSPALVLAIAALLAIATVAILVAVYSRVPTAAPLRLSISMPPGVALAIGENSPTSAVISPDGNHIALVGVNVGTGKVSLYVRPSDSVEMKPLPGTEDAISPFWAPDSRSLGFFAHGRLMRVDLDGGAPREICEASTSGGSGTWNKNDVIVASLKDRGPLFKVSANGGSPVPVTELSPPVIAHGWPHFLPDGKHFLYAADSLKGTENTIHVGSLDSKVAKFVMNGSYLPVIYLQPGQLMFLRRGELMAQPFDTDRLELMGNPVRLAESSLPPFSASDSGRVTYRGRSVAPERFFWTDFEGRELGPVLKPGYYADPQISPDGSRLAFAMRDSPSAPFDIYILELSTGVHQQLTTDPADDRAPVWAPDGKSIAFWSKRQSGPGVYRKNSNGTGNEELLIPYGGDIWLYQWFGNKLMYMAGSAIPEYDISEFSLSDRKDTLLVKTPNVDADGAISPNGKWFAYETNETGRYEVYVTTYPPSETKLSATTAGGVDSIWSPDGRKIFYVNSFTRELMSLDVKSGDPPEFTLRRRLHSGPLDWTSAHSYDVHPTQQRILIQTTTAPQIELTVLLNWRGALEK